MCHRTYCEYSIGLAHACSGFSILDSKQASSGWKKMNEMDAYEYIMTRPISRALRSLGPPISTAYRSDRAMCRWSSMVSDIVRKDSTLRTSRPSGLPKYCIK